LITSDSALTEYSPGARTFSPTLNSNGTTKFERFAVMPCAYAEAVTAITTARIAVNLKTVAFISTSVTFNNKNLVSFRPTPNNADSGDKVGHPGRRKFSFDSSPFRPPSH